MKMISWLNSNAGVIAAIQTVITAFLSILAIKVAVKISKYPYSMNLTIYSGLDGFDGDYKLELNLYNAGNVPLYIKNIYVVKEHRNGDKDEMACANERYRPDIFIL